MSRAAAPPFFYLRPHEGVLRKDGAAPGYALAWFLALAAPPTVLAAAGLVALAFFPDAPVRRGWILGAWAALVLLAAFVARRRQATTEYVLTDERIYARTGRFVTRVHLATHDKVTDVRYRRGPLDRLLGVAELTFSTAGGDLRLPGLRDALALKEAAERARDAYVQRLLEAARIERAHAQPVPTAAHAADASLPATAGSGAPAPAADAPPTPPPAPWTGARPDYLKSGDEPQWLERPTPVASLGALKSLVGVLAFVVVTQVMQEGRNLPYVLPLAALGAALFVGLRLLQLRRTEYVATDRRVYARSGLVGTTVRQLTYDKITDITYRQDVLGRILGYGTVSLATAGGDESAIHLHGLARPLQAKETVEALRGRYLREERG